jgi:Rod binding domain-containing protein
MAGMPIAAPSPAATATLESLDTKALAGKAAKAAKAHEVAQDFEQVFVNSMFQQMFSGVGNGPFNGGPGAAIWRSFLSDEYAKSFVRSGGIGIADQVQRELLARQEVS